MKRLPSARAATIIAFGSLVGLAGYSGSPTGIPAVIWIAGALVGTGLLIAAHLRTGGRRALLIDLGILAAAAAVATLPPPGLRFAGELVVAAAFGWVVYRRERRSVSDSRP